MSAADATGEVPEIPLLIGGEPLQTGAWLEVMEPAAPARRVGRVALATEELARRAVEHAERTSRAWGQLAPQLAMDNRAPFGGFRQSGLGRELGSEGLRELAESQTITFPV